MDHSPPKLILDFQEQYFPEHLYDQFYWMTHWLNTVGFYSIGIRVPFNEDTPEIIASHGATTYYVQNVVIAQSLPGARTMPLSTLGDDVYIELYRIPKNLSI